MTKASLKRKERERESKQKNTFIEPTNARKNTESTRAYAADKNTIKIGMERREREN